MQSSVHPVDEMLPAGKLTALGLQHVLVMYAGAVAVPLIVGRALNLPPEQVAHLISADLFCCGLITLIQAMGATRSEEHTSELQSQSNLVCRLLLEKKKLIRIQSALILPLAFTLCFRLPDRPPAATPIPGSSLITEPFHRRAARAVSHITVQELYLA